MIPTSVPVEQATYRALLLMIVAGLRDVEDAVADLKAQIVDLQRAVADVAARVGPTVDALTAALAAERAAAVALAEVEAAEDVTQGQAITDAQAALAAAVAETDAAAAEIGVQVGKLDAIATGA